MNVNPISAIACAALVAGCLGAQGVTIGGRPQQPLATVEVAAFDTRGQFLGRPAVMLFESDGHKNLAARFRAGIAEGIPFGEYRIEGRLPGYFAEARYVSVYQKRTTIILGLTVGHELPVMPLSLHGKVIGEQVGHQKGVFVKLAGVFSNVSVESAIGSEGDFDLAGLSWGAYILMVIGEQRILASRLIEIPYDGPPMVIEIGRSSALGGKVADAPIRDNPNSDWTVLR